MSSPRWNTVPLWLARIRWGEADAVRGAGTLVDPQHVLTAAHVLVPSTNTATVSRPEGPVWLDFPHVTPAQDPVAAHVIAWSPPAELDVAVLRLSEPVAGTSPAPLIAHGSGAIDQPVGAQGFPQGLPASGATWRGCVTSVQKELLELRAEDGIGLELEHGFSGAGLWDRAEDAVIGVVVARAKARQPDAQAPAVSPRMGWATPLNALSGLWEGFRDLPAVSPSRLRDLTAVGLVEGRLPTIADVGRQPEIDARTLGVERGGEDYVDRPDLEAQITATLADAPFLLVVGHPAAGKSRTLLEVLRREAGDRSLIVPRDAEALNVLASRPIPVAPTGGVLWLDRLDELLKPPGLDLEVLRNLGRQHPPIRIVATIQGKALNRLDQGMGLLGYRPRALLSKARQVHVPEQLNNTELAEALRKYPDLDPNDRRLGHYLVSGPTLEAMYRYGSDTPGADAGWAVMRAAVDWRRAGVESPVPESCLAELAASYPGGSIDEVGFAEGLAWATGLREHRVQAIRQAPSQGTGRERYYEPSRDLVGIADRAASVSSDPIPESVWRQVAGSQRVESGDLLAVMMNAGAEGLTGVVLQAAENIVHRGEDAECDGWAAFMHGQIDEAEERPADATRWYRKAIDVGGSAIGWARVSLAARLLDDGDLEGSEELLGLADDPDPSLRRLATAVLGSLRMRQGDFAAAEPLLVEVAASGDPQSSSYARAHLGVMRITQPSTERAAKTSPAGHHGDRRGEARLLQGLREAGGLLAVDLARAGLGWLRISQGDADEARDLFGAVGDSSDPGLQALAQAGTGHLLLQEGRLDEAAEQFSAVAVARHPLGRCMAALGQAQLHQARGEWDEAASILGELTRSGHAEFAPMAADLLGDLLLERGDPDAAEGAYRQAIDSGHRDWSQMARIDLALLLETRADAGGAAVAEDLLRTAVNSGHRENGPRAADLLGDLLLERGDYIAAEVAYRQAIDSGHQNWSQIARIDLANLLTSRGESADHESAADLLRTVADSGHEHCAPQAADLLGDLLFHAERLQEAREEYQRAVDSGHPRWSPTATVDLGILDATEGMSAQALKRFSEATRCPDTDISGVGHLLRGLLHLELGDEDASEADLRHAAGASREETRFQAQAQLTVLNARAGRLTEADDTARKSSEQVTAWTGEPPQRPVREDAAPGRWVIQFGDLLYDLGDQTCEHLFEAVVEGAADPGTIRAAKIRIARQRYSCDSFDDAVDLLRPALSDLRADRGPSYDDLPPERWADEVIARRHLSLAVLRRTDRHSSEELEEAWELLAPIAEGPPDADTAAALVVRGRAATLIARQEREHDRGASAKDWRDRARLLFEEARSTAVESEDEDTVREADSGIDDLSHAMGEFALSRPDGEPSVSPRQATDNGGSSPTSAQARGASGQSVPGAGEGLTCRTLALLALVASGEGELAEATHWLNRARQASTTSSGGASGQPDAVSLDVIEAVLCWEQDDRDAARRALARAKPPQSDPLIDTDRLRRDIDLVMSDHADHDVA